MSGSEISLSKMSLSKSNSEVGELVSVLVDDPTLLTNWSQFSDILKCPHEQKKGWEFGLRTRTATYYEIFSEILISWISRNPQKKLSHLCSTLRKMNNVYLAEKLEKAFEVDDLIRISKDNNSSGSRRLSQIPLGGKVGPSSSGFIRDGREINWPISHALLKTTKNFCGREKELEELSSYFHSNEDLILVCGLGGIGKTEFCRKFANDLPQFKGIKISRVWLHGDNPETLRNSMLRLADELGVEHTSETRETGPSASIYFLYLASMILEKCDKLLVILDNVDLSSEEVTKVIQCVKAHHKLFFMVTSRDSSVLNSAGRTIKLEVLENDEARFMLQQSILNVTTSDSDKLCKFLQYYPLALQQAVAYIKQQQRDYRTPKYSVSHYIQEFERKKAAMLDQKLSKFEHDYELTTLVVWDMTLEKISKTSLEIMRILAYSHPDKILSSFLQKIFGAFDLPQDFSSGLQMIHNYSLVQVNSTKFLSIHRLVQEVMRLKIRDPNYSKRLFEIALLLWVQQRPEEFRAAVNYERQQLNTICKFAFGCEIKRTDRFESVLTFLLEHKRLECAVKYTHLCFKEIIFTSGLEDIEKLALLEKVLLWRILSGKGEVSNELVETVAYEVDYYTDSYLPSLKLPLTLAQKHFPKNNESLLCKVQCKLAFILYRKGESKRSISLIQQILNSYLFSSLSEQSYLKLLKATKIQPKVQKELLEKLLQFKRDEMGETHGHTLRVKELLAEVLEQLGQLTPALNLYKQLWEYAVRFYDEEKELEFQTKVMELELRLNVNFQCLTREEIYLKLKNFKNYQRLSLEELERVLALFQSKLGEQERLTLRVKNELAVKLESKGEYEQSLSFIQEIINSNEGDEMEVAYETMGHIGERLLSAKKEYEKSRELLDRVLAFRISTFGEMDWRTNSTKGELAMVFEKLGDFKKALELHTERLNYFRQRYGNSYGHLENIQSVICRLKDKINLNKE